MRGSDEHCEEQQNNVARENTRRFCVNGFGHQLARTLAVYSAWTRTGGDRRPVGWWCKKLIKSSPTNPAPNHRPGCRLRRGGIVPNPPSWDPRPEARQGGSNGTTNTVEPKYRNPSRRRVSPCAELYEGCRRERSPFPVFGDDHIGNPVGRRVP